MALDTRRCFWFGTEDRAGFFATPLKGADSSPSAWGVDGTLLNGGGYGFNSFGSHKRYTYEWPQSSSPETAQIMKSYRDGTYGRGLLYFLEPGIYRTNILPAHWADPSMSLDNEAPSLVYGIDPIAVPTSGGSYLNLPINSAQYDLSSVPVQTVPTPDSSVFLPVPTGHTLFLGAFYSSTGTGGIFATPINSNGTLGVTVKLTEKSNADTDVVVDRFEGDIKGVRLWVGRSSAVDSSVTIAAMSGRLLETIDAVSYGPWVEQARNLFTNPSFETGGSAVEVRRNFVQDPRFTTPGNWSFLGTSSALASNGVYTATIGPTPPTSNFLIPAQLAWYPVVDGESVSAAYLVENAGSSTASFRMALFNGTTYTYGPTETLAPGDTRRVSGTVISSGGATYQQPRLHAVTVLTGAVLRISQPQWEKSPVLNPYADPVVGTGDPDLTATWSGTANASAVVISGVQVSGVVATNCFAIRSVAWKKEGNYSVRQIPNSSVSNSYIDLGVPAGSITPASTTVTLVGTRYIPTPITGTLSAQYGTVTVYDGAFRASTPLPNTPGEGEARVTFGPTGATNGAKRVMLHHGGAIGSGDVWWDLAGLFEGTYAGPAFSGSTPATSDQEQFRWLGPVDASASVYETRTRTGDPSTQAALVAGPWIGGQGHSGCRFIGTPSYVNNGPVEGGRVGFAASFVEVGSWVYG